MDYTATVLNSVVPLSWACALLLLRRVGPVRRGRVLLTVGAAGFVAMLSATPSGTLLGQSWADWPWAIGAMTGVVATMTAGLITLTVPHRWRWTGLLLVTIPVGMGQLALAGAAAWIALAVALPWLAAAGRTRPQLPAARRSRGGVVIATLMAPSAFLGGLALSGGYHPPVRAAAGVVAIGSIVVLLLSIAPTPHSPASRHWASPLPSMAKPFPGAHQRVGRGLCEDDRVTRASLDKQPHEVAAMFDGVAARYDLTNDVLSLGQDRRWRQAVATAVAARPGQRVLDLAAGTGTSSEPFAAAGALVVACDFSPGMLDVGRKRRPRLPFVAGDALALPFSDAVFDAVTISFGLRNLNDIQAGLEEMLRVTRPGGRLVVCEFSHPTWPPFRTVYVEYLMRAIPPLARRVSSSPDAYVYLAESIRAWPDQPALAEVITRAGWSGVRWRDLSGGIVALHHATRPAP